jgi:hypothetical protein
MSEVQAGPKAQHAGLTRGEVAKILRVTTGRIRQLQKAGRLPAALDENGVNRFDREVVFRFARERKKSGKIGEKPKPSPAGDVAAEVFALFRQGLGLPEVVEAMHLPPNVVRDLYDEYTLPLGQRPRRSAGALELEGAARERARALDDERESRR